MVEEIKEENTERDEELDVANAIDKVQNIMRKIVGNLSTCQFKLEQVKQNGANNRYIVISSIVPDLGQDRDYYFIKINVEDGKIVSPMGKGKLIDGKVQFEELEIKSNWEK